MVRMLVSMLVLIFIAACSGSGDAPLLVVTHTPEGDSLGIDPAAVITITFTESLLASTITSGHVTLAGQDGEVPGRVTVTGNILEFVPDAPLALSCAYTVTVSPGIVGIYGHYLHQPSRWSFTTRDGRWETVEPPSGADANTGRAALDDNGRVLLAWSTTVGTVASFLVNGTWTPPVMLGQSGYVEGVVAAHDNFAVLWQVRNGSTIQLCCARYTDGVWQPAESVVTADAEALSVRSVIFSDNSLFVVYWFSGGADGSQTFSRRYVPSQGWLAPEPLGKIPWLVCGFHRSGKAMIAWSDTGSTVRKGYVRNYTVASGWAPLPVTLGESDYLTPHAVAVNGTGTSQAIFSTSDDFLVASTASGEVWTQLSPLLRKQPSTFYGVTQLVMDNHGNSVLTVPQASQYLSLKYDNGTGWQQPVTVSGSRIVDMLQLGASLSVDESGNGLLIWDGYDTIPGIEHVFASRYLYGIGWSQPEHLGPQDADTLSPRVAMNPRGEAVATWNTAVPLSQTDYSLRLGMALFH